MLLRRTPAFLEIIHADSHDIVEQYSDFTCRRGHYLGVANPGHHALSAFGEAFAAIDRIGGATAKRRLSLVPEAGGRRLNN